MLIFSLLQRAAAGIRAGVAAVDRARSRRALSAIQMLDDHLLWDIGLTRADVVACLSMPSGDDPIGFLEAQRARNAAGAGRPRSDGRRLAA
jgi:uncharacterized protein YjiS (DUF1127 family)